eukprot:NODE_1212_length_1034_cov_44.160406_g838_i0.p4 GENE.NODE_1212_length_1034_cov_44.160406_g838_i0~~NODE_1212_length_1034_cov_44.160406_g838_i0.p4  ORF type:complete len:115 (+),score=8.60 NODE_1212_length_1034_cov_44.160406_g838_i0:594-938(+)
MYNCLLGCASVGPPPSLLFPTPFIRVSDTNDPLLFSRRRHTPHEATHKRPSGVRARLPPKSESEPPPPPPPLRDRYTPYSWTPCSLLPARRRSFYIISYFSRTGGCRKKKNSRE